VNCLTLLVQLFFTGRIVLLLGVGVALALLPALTMVGFGVLAFAPSLGTIAIFQVLRRAGDYAIARPTREVLFTVVPREDRYKTKGFIDTFVYRLGDQVGAWSVTLSVALSSGSGSRAAALAAIVLCYFFKYYPGSRSEITLNGAQGIFILAVLANVAYCAAYVADVFAQCLAIATSGGNIAGSC